MSRWLGFSNTLVGAFYSFYTENASEKRALKNLLPFPEEGFFKVK